MDLKNLQRKAKQLIDKRGGNESLKEDAQELKDIATGNPDAPEFQQPLAPATGSPPRSRGSARLRSA